MPVQERNYADEWRSWRNNVGEMSQTSMARILGLSLRTVQGIETGEHKPSPTSRMRFRELVKRYKVNNA